MLVERCQVGRGAVRPCSAGAAGPVMAGFGSAAVRQDVKQDGGQSWATAAGRQKEPDCCVSRNFRSTSVIPPPHPRQAFAIGAYAPVGRHVGDSRERERVRRRLLVSWRYAV